MVMEMQKEQTKYEMNLKYLFNVSLYYISSLTRMKATWIRFRRTKNK